MATDQDEIDARFEELLADYHDLLAEGADESKFWQAVDELPADLRERLQAAGECVRQLLGFASETAGSTERMQAGLTPPPWQPVETFAQPPQIGRFRIERELGRGGNGIVLLGVDPQLGRRVAIKVPLPEILADSSLRQRFLREAEVAARLNHRNLLQIYESAEAGPVCYFSAEYCTGPSLAQWLLRQPPGHLPAIGSVTSLMIQLADGAHHAHARGVLHRDLKPSNVLLEPVEHGADRNFDGAIQKLPLEKYVPKISDFGLAKLLDADGERTRTGTLLGTLWYMSPEQAEGRVRDISVQSDVYALGAILYELLTGVPPLRGENDRATLQLILFRDPRPPRQLAPHVPRDLEAICLKCLDKQPEARYATAADLADDLRRLQQGIPTTARPVSAAALAAKWVRRRPVIAGLGGLLTVAVLTIVVGTAAYNAQLSRSVAELRQQKEVAKQHERSAREYAYGADMMLAQQAWERAAPLEAQALLKRHIPAQGEEDLRRFEWYGHNRRFEQSSTVIARQPSAVWSLAITADGKFFATGDRAGVVRLWDRERRELVRELRGHAPGDINHVLFLPAGQYLVSAGDDRAIRWWDFTTGECTLVWQEHADWIGGLAISADGKWFASGGGDGRVLLWDVESRALSRELYREAGAIRWIVFMPDQPWLVTASENGKVRVWDYARNCPPAHLGNGELPMPDSNLPSWHNAVVLPGGSRIYAGNRDKICHWDIRPGIRSEAILDELRSSGDSVMAISYLPGRKAVVEAGDAIPAIIAHNATGSFGVRNFLAGHTARIRCLAPLSDGITLLSGSEDGEVREWADIGKYYEGEAADLPEISVEAVWSPDSDRVWVLNQESDIYEINHLDEPTLDNRHRILGASRRIHAYRDKDHLLGIDAEGVVHHWDASAKLQRRVKAFNAVPTCTAIDLSGRWLAFAESGVLGIADMTSGEHVWTRVLESPASEVRFLSQNTLCIGCDDGSLAVFSVADGQQLAHHSAQRARIHGMDVSQSGKFIATAAKDNKVRIFDALTLRELLSFSRAEAPNNVWFIDQDERLLVLEQDRNTGFQASIAHARTGQDLLQFSGLSPGSRVSPDRRWLMTLRSDVVHWRRLTNE